MINVDILRFIQTSYQQVINVCPAPTTKSMPYFNFPLTWPSTELVWSALNTSRVLRYTRKQAIFNWKIGQYLCCLFSDKQSDKTEQIFNQSDHINICRLILIHTANVVYPLNDAYRCNVHISISGCHCYVATVNFVSSTYPLNDNGFNMLYHSLR